MDNIIAISLNEGGIRPHELAVVTEARPVFLPQATLARSGEKWALLYSKEGLVPLARYGDGPEAMALSELFAVLSGYIRLLISARDMLLDTCLMSSDPENGVFVQMPIGAAVGRPAEAQSAVYAVKAVWGADGLSQDGEKVCRIARSLAGRERVMGAKASMDRIAKIIRSGNLSLIDCLKAAEGICREWNHIVQAA